MSGQLLGATALGLATLAWPVRLRRRGRAAVIAALLSAAAVLMVAALASHFTPDLASAVSLTASDPPLVDHPAVDWIEFLTMLAFATAAIGLIRVGRMPTTHAGLVRGGGRGRDVRAA